jgi:hypothetical protein
MQKDRLGDHNASRPGILRFSRFGTLNTLPRVRGASSKRMCSADSSRTSDPAAQNCHRVWRAPGLG